MSIKPNKIPIFLDSTMLVLTVKMSFNTLKVNVAPMHSRQNTKNVLTVAAKLSVFLTKK